MAKPPPIVQEAPEVIRFKELKQKGIPVMFIDSMLPGHQRMNYALLGDTASENPDFSPMITSPHSFQLGMAMCPPGQGPAYHTHDYIECFFVLKGEFRFWYGDDPEKEPTQYVDLGPWDTISIPVGLWRRFENISDEPGWYYAVLEKHEVFESKDPYWAGPLVRQAEDIGFYADDKGKMIKPSNFEVLEQQMNEKLEAYISDDPAND